MNFKVLPTKRFLKELKNLSKKYPSIKADVAAMGLQLKVTPQMGDALGNNLYKVRLAITSKGRGKRGGARMINYVLIQHEIVYLASIYDKSEFETVDEEAIFAFMKQAGIIPT